MDDTRAEVKNFILKKFYPGEDPANLTDDTELKESGVLDSLVAVELAEFLEQRFGIELEASDLETGNLVSITTIANLVEKKVTGG
jgi:acyl carrier protein